jgi:hypothetical protein
LAKAEDRTCGLRLFLHLAVVIVQHSSHGSGVDAMIGKDRGVMYNIMPRSTE